MEEVDKIDICSPVQIDPASCLSRESAQQIQACFSKVLFCAMKIKQYPIITSDNNENGQKGQEQGAISSQEQVDCAFMREFECLKLIQNHPSLPKLIGHNTDVIVTCAEKGTPLQKCPLDWFTAGTVNGWYTSIKSALLHLSKLGIVHGDVCQSNIIVRIDGTATLVDFGKSAIQGKPWSNNATSSNDMKSFCNVCIFMLERLVEALGHDVTSVSNVENTKTIWLGLRSRFASTTLEGLPQYMFQ